MKKAAQFVAVLVVLLLVAQPANAGLNCTAKLLPCMPGCPMHQSMSDMGPDCPMSMQMAAHDCSPSCCPDITLRNTAAMATPTKLRFTLAALAVASSAEASPAVETAAISSPNLIRFASSPPYLLNQVFRI